MKCQFLGENSMGFVKGEVYDIDVDQLDNGMVVLRRPQCPYSGWHTFWRVWRFVGVRGDRQTLNLPVRPFLYTLDQVASMLNLTEVWLKNNGYLFFKDRSPGVQAKSEMLAINIAPRATDKPEWRIEERELIRWMKRQGFRVID